MTNLLTGVLVEPSSKELARLRALDSYSILATPSEPIFDALTSLGAYSFGAPICLIALIGEHIHFFKSAYGTDQREALREGSFSDVALLGDEPLVVLDAELDPRFAASPLVRSQRHIRFYAGAPLVCAGHKLGTFCIFDRVSRSSFGPQEIEALKHMALLASKAIEQRLLAQLAARAEREVKKATEHTRQILEATTDDVFLLDRDWRFTYINEKANSHMARGRELLGMNFWEAFPHLIGTPFEHNYRKAVRERIPVLFEDYSKYMDAYLEINAHPCGEGLAVFFRDVTPKRIQEALLHKAEERYRLATLTTTEGIWDWDCETGATYFSARWQAILGLPAVDFEGTHSHWLERIHPRDKILLEQRTLEQNLPVVESAISDEFEFEYRMCHEDGSWHWIKTHGTSVRDQQGKIVRMLGAIKDITGEKTLDPLTGLHNRGCVLQEIEQWIAQAESTAGVDQKEGESFALLVINVDQFARINDSFGMKCGDQVLIEVARRIEKALNSRIGGMAGRLSGADFVVLLGHVRGIQDVIAFADSIHVVLEKPVQSLPEQVMVSASIGIAMGDTGYKGPERILEDAMVALNEVKPEGRGHSAVFDIEMRDRTRRRVQLEADLREALADGQLRLHYQPKVVLVSGEIVGFEALVRWIHPVRGLISPAEFIPYAEESGLIIQIGYWTLREAIRQLMRWRIAGLVTEKVTMAVNLSTKQFEMSNLVSEIRRCLAEENAPAACLTLELTESALIGDMGHTKESLGGLSELGIKIDMDDFGTGYSSLSYLHMLPFHSLKIDQSFTRNLVQSQESQAIVRSILQLGQSLNMDVIAEGIETLEQRDCLAEFGCHLGQGYFYSRPLGGESMEEMLRHGINSQLIGVQILLPAPLTVA